MNKTTSQTPQTINATLAPSGLLQRACACGQHTVAGGKCSACSRQKHSLQPTLQVSEPGDQYEREADRIADQVMTAPGYYALGGVKIGGFSRLQQSARDTEGPQSKAVSEAEQAVGGSGAPLSSEMRSYFEPRFGYDFSGVRIHSDIRAASAAEAIHARAYTIGQHIAFASAEFAPASSGGRQLLAHELAHVVQQQGQERIVQRTVAPTSNCPANVHGAPADPIAELKADDERAQHMALGTSNVLGFEAVNFADPTLGRSYVTDAYERRFGLAPSASGGRFRDRFSGRLYNTQNDAMREEMLFLSDRFRTLHNFLRGPIHYRCPGTSAFTLPGFATITCGGAIAYSGGGQIAICRTFWTFPLMQTVDQRGGNMIHESVHMRLGFMAHGLGNADQRGQNSECHAALVADVYGFQSDDTSDCTPLIP